MWAIAKKELKSYLDQPTGYILLIIFLALSAFFFFRIAFASGEASLRPLFDLLPWIMLFFIPAVTMRAFAAEKKDGTIETVLTHPVTEVALILGKLLGNFLFILLATAFTIFFAIGLSFGGRLDLGVIVAQYFGLILFSLALTAIGLFASTLTKSQTVAFIIALLIAFVLIVSGLELVTMAVPFPLDYLFREISLLNHFDALARGVIDLRDVVYFLTVSFVFLALARFIIKRQKYSLSSQIYKDLTLQTAIFLVAGFVVVLTASVFSGRLDLTAGHLYSLAPATVKTLQTLDKPLKLTLYASSEIPAEYRLTLRDVKDLLADYRFYGGQKVKLIFKNPDTQGEQQQAQMAGVTPVQFNVMRQDEFQVKQGYFGLVIEYGKKKEVIPFIDSFSDLEYRLTSAIKKLSRSKKRTVVLLTGEGPEKHISKVQKFLTELEKEYSVAQSLAEVKLEPSLTAAVILVGTDIRLNKDEILSLRRYLEKGGSVFALVDGVKVDPQVSTLASENEKRWQELLKPYGVSVQPTLIYDLKANETIALGQGANQYILPYPFWLKALPASGHPVLRNLRDVTLGWASPLKISPKTKYTSLLVTSAYAGEEKDRFNIAPTNNSSINNENLRRFLVAASVKAKKGRLVIVGDSDFVSEQFSDKPENLAFAFNTVDWLSQDEELITIRTKDVAPHQLVFSSEITRNFVRYFNLIGLPLLIALAGLIHLRRRHSLSMS